jgi:hypothetical protein
VRETSRSIYGFRPKAAAVVAGAGVGAPPAAGSAGAGAGGAVAAVKAAAPGGGGILGDVILERGLEVGSRV